MVDETVKALEAERKVIEAELSTQKKIKSEREKIAIEKKELAALKLELNPTFKSKLLKSLTSAEKKFIAGAKVTGKASLKLLKAGKQANESLKNRKKKLKLLT